MENNKIERIDLALIPKDWNVSTWMILFEEKILVIDTSKERYGYVRNPFDTLENFKSKGYKIIDLSKYPHITK